MTPMAPVDDRADRTTPRWPQLVAIGAGLALLALSFTTYYRYDPGLATRELCTLDGGTPCPGPIDSQTAWHGYPGWIAVVIALLAAACATVRLVARHRRVGRAGGVAYAELTLFVFATAGLAFAGVAIPKLIPSLDDVARTVGGGSSSGGITDSDLVTNHLAWGYWVSLAVAIVGVAAALIDIWHVRDSRDAV
jgi:hypothetical protein